MFSAAWMIGIMIATSGSRNGVPVDTGVITGVAVGEVEPTCSSYLAKTTVNPIVLEKSYQN